MTEIEVAATGPRTGGDDLGLPLIRFHDLRHTFATLSLKAGIPTEVVSRILGHKDPGITQVFYQHAVPSLEDHAVRCPGGRSARRVGLPSRYQTVWGARKAIRSRRSLEVFVDQAA